MFPRARDNTEVKFLRGQTYEAEKKEHGGDGSNQHSAKQKAHDAPLANTAEKVAAQFDVDPATIKRDAEFARAVNAIAETGGASCAPRFSRVFSIPTSTFWACFASSPRV